MDGDRKELVATILSGRGLLDIRALWAAIVGPQRLAISQRTTVGLRNDSPIEISKNLGVSNCYLLIGVATPHNLPALNVVFGREDQGLGQNTGWPITLLPASQGSMFQFTQLIAPGEQLFAQIMDPAVPQQNVVVAAAVF